LWWLAKACHQWYLDVINCKHLSSMLARGCKQVITSLGLEFLLDRFRECDVWSLKSSLLSFLQCCGVWCAKTHFAHHIGNIITLARWKWPLWQVFLCKMRCIFLLKYVSAFSKRIICSFFPFYQSVWRPLVTWEKGWSADATTSILIDYMYVTFPPTWPNPSSDCHGVSDNIPGCVSIEAARSSPFFPQSAIQRHPKMPTKESLPPRIVPWPQVHFLRVFTTWGTLLD